MTSKFGTGATRVLRTTVACGALLLAVGGAAACGDDSTATAPTTAATPSTSAVTSSSVAASSETASSSADATNPSSTEGPVDTSGLPATAPSSAAPRPASGKADAYLGELKRENVAFANDADNSVALGAATVVCQQRAAKASPADISATVLPIVGSGKTDVSAAGADADKVIAAATKYYC
ncbi:DUF732 domain-containing protein [Williamsia sterculiae]|uniref:DUF732 domain-containing protein n=1 Tax=Williamsia sterculiae TaxID=1344003 RepID=A0A1N7H8N8_9NOCA|nr:DUF732 domain-containing protein [Williamsia sterculiae]SIS21161.1 Protein of unknown function [Williamsia sterculiae]